MRKFVVLLCVTCFVLGVTGEVRAQDPASEAAVSFTGVSVDGKMKAYWNSYIGWSFTPSSNILVTHLGIYDDLDDGDYIARTVGIFDASLNNVVNTTVGIGVTPDKSFVYAGCTSVTLLSEETYYIFSDAGDQEFYAFGVEGFETAGYIGSIQNAYLNGNLAAWNGHIDVPIAIDADPNIKGFFGPNFKGVAVVPIPGGVWLLGSALVGLVGFRKRFSRT